MDQSEQQMQIFLFLEELLMSRKYLPMRLGVRGAVGAVCAAAVAVYAWPLLDPSRQWDFVIIWDDHENFFENNVYQGLTLVHLHAMATLSIINVWEPLGWLHKALVYAAAGLDSRFFRIATLVLHLGTSAVLARTAAYVLAIMHSGVFLGRQHISQPDDDQLYDTLSPGFHQTGCMLSSLLVFTVHPINIEVVGWPSAQPYALAAFFSVLSLFFHCRRLHRAVLKSVESKSPRAARGASPETENLPSDWDRLFDLVAPSLGDLETQLAAGCFVAAVLSKSVCVLLPVASVLVDLLIVIPVGLSIRSRSHHFPSSGHCTKLIVRFATSKLLLVVAAVLFVIVTLVVNHEGAHKHADVITLTLDERIVKALAAPAWTLFHVLWPAKLRAHYELLDDEISLWTNPEYCLAVVSLPLVLGGIAAGQSKYRVASLLAITHFCVMLLPTCGLIQHGIVTKGTDRYAYFPILVLVPVIGYWLTYCLNLAPHTRENAQLDCPVDHENDTHRSRDKAELSLTSRGCAAPARAAFGAALVIMLVISRHQLLTWQNSEALLSHSLRLDRSDSRMACFAFNYKLRWGGGCGEDFADCKDLLNLSYYFAPAKNLKARLFRYMILYLLGRRDLACEGYQLLETEFPTSAIVQNNLAMCALLDNRFAESRDRIRNAQTMDFYCNRDRRVISDNYFRIEEWMLEVAKTNGQQQPPFEGRIVW